MSINKEVMNIEVVTAKELEKAVEEANELYKDESWGEYLVLAANLTILSPSHAIDLRADKYVLEGAVKDMREARRGDYPWETYPSLVKSLRIFSPIQASKFLDRKWWLSLSTAVQQGYDQNRGRDFMAPASALKIGLNDDLSSYSKKEEIWESLLEFEEFARTERWGALEEWQRFGRFGLLADMLTDIKICYPEEMSRFKLDETFWSNCWQVLNYRRQEAAKNKFVGVRSIIELATDLKMLVAKDIMMTPNGLRVVMPTRTSPAGRSVKIIQEEK